MKTIVLARVESESVLSDTEFERFNGNFYPKRVERPKAVAMVWKNNGTSEDEERAKLFAAGEGYSVITFPGSEKDPLGKAKARILP